MTTTDEPTTTPGSASRPLRGERLAWWIVFTVLTLSVLGMAGLWN